MKEPDDPGKEHTFGGAWTRDKLDVLARYLAAYTKVLKGKPFKTAYIDAFAGTGHIAERARKGDAGSSGSLFPDPAQDDSRELLDGSARRALKTVPRFDRYLFIERDPARCAQLEKLREEFPELAKDIEVHLGEANARIQELCGLDWRRHRAVLFLDPYGMQVEWTTIERIAATRAIDLWVLFPLGMGVSRLLKRKGDVPIEWRRRLDSFLGTTDWHDELYETRRQPTLFDEPEELIAKARIDVIGGYFVKRLRTVFAGVSDDPRILRNSRNAPLYLLCFAAANERGAPIALRIADYLLKEGTA